MSTTPKLLSEDCEYFYGLKMYCGLFEDIEFKATVNSPPEYLCLINPAKEKAYFKYERCTGKFTYYKACPKTLMKFRKLYGVTLRIAYEYFE